MSEAVVEGIVVSYRTGPKNQYSKQYIIQFPGIRSHKDAARLIGRKVASSVGKNTLRGEIIALHGKNGMVRARFRKGLPGLSGIRVKIIG